jgi:hypothetical protein
VLYAILFTFTNFLDVNWDRSGTQSMYASQWEIYLFIFRHVSKVNLSLYPYFSTTNKHHGIWTNLSRLNTQSQVKPGCGPNVVYKYGLWWYEKSRPSISSPPPPPPPPMVGGRSHKRAKSSKVIHEGDFEKGLEDDPLKSLGCFCSIVAAVVRPTNRVARNSVP